MYHNLQQLYEQAQERKESLWKVVLQNEQDHTGMSETAVYAGLRQRYEIMCSSAGRAIQTDELSGAGTLITGLAKQHDAYGKEKGGLCGGFLNQVMARALSCSEVNAAMGRICAAPTAGACGVLPAVLLSIAERWELETQMVLEGLLTASGVGAVIMKNGTVSGAEGGCQAECGAAAAMAAAAAVYLCGGTNRQQLDAAAFALSNAMGLICDPVAGLVQVPCAQRNASQAVNALLSADMALGGMTAVIPVDEVIEAMYQTGKMLPAALKETAMGGLAATKTGQKLKKNLGVN